MISLQSWFLYSFSQINHKCKTPLIIVKHTNESALDSQSNLHFAILLVLKTFLPIITLAKTITVNGWMNCYICFPLRNKRIVAVWHYYKKKNIRFLDLLLSSSSASWVMISLPSAAILKPLSLLPVLPSLLSSFGLVAGQTIKKIIGEENTWEQHLKHWFYLTITLQKPTLHNAGFKLASFGDLKLFNYLETKKSIFTRFLI